MRYDKITRRILFALEIKSKSACSIKSTDYAVLQKKTIIDIHATFNRENVISDPYSIFNFCSIQAAFEN